MMFGFTDIGVCPKRKLTNEMTNAEKQRTQIIGIKFKINN